MPRAKKRDWFVNRVLINARISKGYSLAELADMAGICFSSVEKYEKMKCFPSNKIAERIAKVLGSSVKILFPDYVRESTPIVNKYRRGYGRGSIEDGRIFCCELSALGRILVEDKDELCRDELIKRVGHALSQLNYREREVLKLYFGITDEFQYSLKEIGKILQCCPENVRQIKAGAFEKIRKYPKKYGYLQELVH